MGRSVVLTFAAMTPIFMLLSRLIGVARVNAFPRLIRPATQAAALFTRRVNVVMNSHYEHVSEPYLPTPPHSLHP